jgi:hypothetical protein
MNLTRGNDGRETEIEIFIAIDEMGSYVVNTDGATDAVDALAEDYACECIATHKLTLIIPNAKVTEASHRLLEQGLATRLHLVK